MAGDPDGSDEQPSTLDLRWVWSAMPPAQRCRRLGEMRVWVQWLITEYRDLRGEIPPCWYRHGDGLHRLTALYVGWIRTYVEAGDGQRDLSLVEWHDALDRTRERLTFPSRCIEGLHHPRNSRSNAADDFSAWLTSQEATHPAQQFVRPSE